MCKLLVFSVYCVYVVMGMNITSCSSPSLSTISFIEPQQSISSRFRIIDCVPRNQWDHIVTYDPLKSFVNQIQENVDKQGIAFSNNRFTRLQINNYMININCDAEIPHNDSKYALDVFVKESDGSKQSIFEKLSGDKKYILNFHNVQEVDHFLQRVHDSQNKKLLSFQNMFLSNGITLKKQKSQTSEKPLKSVINCVPRDQWNQITVYNPMKSFANQIQENEDKKGNHTSFDRFTKLKVNNLVINIDSDTKIPYYNSMYTLYLWIQGSDGLEQITFKTISNNGKGYALSFVGIQEVDDFLQHLNVKGNVSYELAMFQKNKWDLEFRNQ